jgi:hypothetical protein
LQAEAREREQQRIDAEVRLRREREAREAKEREDQRRREREKEAAKVCEAVTREAAAVPVDPLALADVRAADRPTVLLRLTAGRRRRPLRSRRRWRPPTPGRR